MARVGLLEKHAPEKRLRCDCTTLIKTEKPQVRICNYTKGFLEKLRVWPTDLLNQTREPLGSLRALSSAILARGQTKYRRVYLKNISMEILWR